MARVIRTPRRSDRDRLRAQRVLKEYRVYRKKDHIPLIEFVAHFDTLWRAAQEFGVTEHDGIEKLVELLPNSWREWAARTARRYTWHEPVTDDMEGDMAGFRKAVYCALVDSRDEQPPREVEEENAYEDKYVVVHEVVAGQGAEGGLGMVPGYEDDYEGETEEDPEEEPEEGPLENPEEDNDEDPEEGLMEEDD